ncbi:MAG: hypothetical protein QG654_143 [Patescibacteria group bacterium]|nr:hypothetical protein [Patescibacteria group bacterium]
MAKKTLIISLVYYPEFVGGAEVAVKEITDRSSSGSFDMITLIGSAKERVTTLGAVRVFRVGFRVNHQKFLGKVLFNFQKYLFPFLVFIKGISLMKENKYDIVWSIMANYAGFGALFLKLRFPSVKLLLTLQEGDPIKYIKRRVFLVYPLFKMIFKKADTIQTISNYLKDFALSMKGKNIKVVPNGVDINNFTKEFLEEEKSLLKEKLNIKNSDVVLVTTSRLVVKNGIKDVVSAMSLLPEKYKFLIIGEGPLRQDLENLVRGLGLSARVSFLGFIPHKDIPSYFSVSDIFIRTSLSEGLGNSFLEAMAFGLPVVATPVGGIVDFIKDGVTGVLVMPEDKEGIKEGILRLENREFLLSIKNQGKDLAVKSYDWNNISKEFDSILKNI